MSKIYSNCEYFSLLRKFGVSISVINNIYLYFVLHWTKSTFDDYLKFVYFYVVDDLDVFYDNTPDLEVNEEIDFISALEKIYS